MLARMHAGESELQMDAALKIAVTFRLIPDFPRDHAVAESLAEVLIKLCRGAILDNCWWPPVDQARWLQEEARDTWEKWRGVPALREVFFEKFGNPKQEPKPEQQRCPSCEGSGFVCVEEMVDGRGGKYGLCGCRIGRMLEPSVLEELNNPTPTLLLPPPPESALNAGAIQKVLECPITEEDVQREKEKRRRESLAKQISARKDSVIG